MNQGNSHGALFQPRGKLRNMEAFDRLPKALREALRNADHNWAGAQCLGLVRKHKTAGVIAILKTQDKAKHERDAAQGLICPGQR
jgi:hypothetical protein